MSYNAWLLLTDIGMIGVISAFIIALAIVLGRREDRENSEARSARLTLEGEEFMRRAS